MTNQELDIKIAEAHQRVCASIDNNFIELVTIPKKIRMFQEFRVWEINTADEGKYMIEIEIDKNIYPL